MVDPNINLRDYMRQRDVQFHPEIGRRYLDLLIRYACGIGKVKRSVVVSLLHQLGWTEKTLEYHVRLVRDCDARVPDRLRQSTERLSTLAAAFGLRDWFDDKFPVPRMEGDSGSTPVRTSVVFRADPWDLPRVPPNR